MLLDHRCIQRAFEGACLVTEAVALNVNVWNGDMWELIVIRVTLFKVAQSPKPEAHVKISRLRTISRSIQQSHVIFPK